MKQSYLLKPAIILLLVSFGMSNQSFAQKPKKGKLNIAMDSVDASLAYARKNTYWKAMEKRDKHKVTQTVSFDVETLKQILDSCAAKGIEKIHFQFAMMRQEDVARYSNRHQELSLTQEDKDALADRLTLLIKVPKGVVDGFAKTETKPSSTTGLSSIRDPKFINTATNQFGFGSAGSTYIDVGTICPPPLQCDEF